MTGGKKIKPGIAVGLMCGLSLLFAAAVLLSSARLRAEPALQTRSAPAETERLLAGRDEPEYTALELLPGERINVNTAAREELKRLPGIGDALADAILQDREENGPYTAAEDLLRVPGIGEKRLEAIRDLISLEDLSENAG